MEQFSKMFFNLDRRIVNETGINGLFDFHFEYATPSSIGSGPTVPLDETVVAPSIFTVMGRLGLKLEETKGTGEFLVIDGIERPTEN